MLTNEQTAFYRASVKYLLNEFRILLFVESGRTRYPTDSSIASLLGLSSTAFSSITRCCSSMSGVVLQNLMFEIAKRSAPGDFASTISEFVKGVPHVFSH